MDWRKDKFGAFHYNQKSIAFLDKPLTIDDMIELYADLGQSVINLIWWDNS